MVPQKPLPESTIAKIGDLQSAPKADLLALRAALEIVMKHRKIAFSVGDIGEQLVMGLYNSTPGLPNLQLAPTGTKNVDALSREGDRYSIKTVWNARKTGTIYPDADHENRQLFEYLVVAKLNDQLTLEAAYEFDWQTFVDVRKWDKRMSAFYVGLSRKALAMARPVRLPQ